MVRICNPRSLRIPGFGTRPDKYLETTFLNYRSDMYRDRVRTQAIPTILSLGLSLIVGNNFSRSQNAKDGVSGFSRPTISSSPANYHEINETIMMSMSATRWNKKQVD